MSDKVYVKIRTEQDEEGEPLQVVTTYEHKIDRPTFIVWLDK